ncbi:hypothetical protein BBJ28_00013170 [Nothophytophthora sp. Chile5]|nr:hypothetical protein BBJ28_00013170 [Nothophytophthora sp. Chile5]
MAKLSPLKPATAFRESALLCPVKQNITRWSSTYHMLKRLIRIEEHITMLEEGGSIQRGDIRKVKDIMKSLAAFESVMTDIQGEGVHIGEMRDSFQLMLLDNLGPQGYMDSDADITFEMCRQDPQQSVWVAET